MRKLNVVFGVVAATGAAGWLMTLFLAMYWMPRPAKGPVTGQVPVATFAPPTPQSAPPDIRDAVMLGYNIMKHTDKYAPKYVGNKLSCTNCHFDGGLSMRSISLVGVAASYPKFRTRTNYATDLVSRTNECFERSMNGHALPVDSHEMQALMTYFAWISKDIPIYSKMPWLGQKKIKSGHTPDAVAGETVYLGRCAACHGGDGQGTGQGPAVWGAQSYNDGAGMAKVDNLASFVRGNMPWLTANLSDEQSLDVAAYVEAQPRPHFQKKR